MILRNRLISHLSPVVVSCLLLSSCVFAGVATDTYVPNPAPSSVAPPAKITPAPTPTASPSPPVPPQKPTTAPAAQEVRFGDDGYTEFGNWHADVSFTPQAWQPGTELKLSTTLHVAQSHLDALDKAGIKADGFCLLVTAERTFDSDGWLRLAGDERMSTLLTPAGLPIEGDVQGAVTNRFGYGFRTPVDAFQSQPLRPANLVDGKRTVTFQVTTRLPDNLPPGIYRLRLDYGVTIKNRYLSLNGQTFTYRPFFKGRPTESHLYSPPTESRFAPDKELVVMGNSTARTVHFAAITPGAVLDQGSVPVVKGRFEYHFNPAEINRRVPIYDTTNLRTGQPEIKDVVHLNLFSEETTPGGKPYHSSVRLILRGNAVIYSP